MKLLPSTIIAVGGGKGGVGKSFFASNLACGLAKNGRSVILVDADLAGANIHILFGIKYPERTLGDYLKKNVAAFADILLPTQLPNLSLICGASDLLEIANPHYAQKQKIISEIARLNVDTIVIDIGAGASLNNLDFFNTADTGIIVTTPSPTALQSGYAFLKMAVHRRILGLFAGDPSLKHELTAAFSDSDRFKNIRQILDHLKGIDPSKAEQANTLLIESRYRLVVNMATESEGQRVDKALGGVAYQYLNVNLQLLGVLAYDVNVENSIRKMEPLFFGAESAITRAFTIMAGRFDSDTPPVVPFAPVESDGVPDASRRGVSSSRVQLSLQDEVFWQGTKLHIQTEDLGMDKGQIVTLVFSGGLILLSRKTDYHDILNRNDVQHTVAERVKTQHHNMLVDINKGLVDDELLKRKGP
jgi:flagellar biosynthesis protein FlhG